jgi:pentose-5-phosphate-3-epimerase
MKIIPSVLEKDFTEVKKKLDFLVEMKDKNHTDFDLVQIDICDGEFVKNKTWIFNPENLEEREILNSYRKYFDLEFHLMCLHQKKHFEDIKRVNARTAVIHLDALFENKHTLSFRKRFH